MRFMVLYPQQDQLSNLQSCWNWYETRTGRAQREADSIAAAIEHVCASQPADRHKVALVGMSAGAGLASLLAIRLPGRFLAVVMHSGIAPGQASSYATALRAMGGRAKAVALTRTNADQHLPALLVIQGSSDSIVASINGTQSAQLWADREGALPGRVHAVRRGKRYAADITDYYAGERQVATLCMVHGLGHAWSGGAAGQPYSDPLGPDASRLAWSFIKKQIARSSGKFPMSIGPYTPG